MAKGSPFTALCQALGTGNQFSRADLHLHSTFSDGAYQVEELASLGRRAGLAAMALTDHDTIAGWPTFSLAVKKAGLTPVCGVEITASHENREIHILGLGVSFDFAPLIEALDLVREARLVRYGAMIESLKKQGITGLAPHWENAQKSMRERPGLALGRRHLAEELIRLKQASSIRQAFDRWLKTESITGLPKARIPSERAIELIQQAGGIASWAHPQEKDFDSQYSGLVELGLDALEAEYPDFKNRRIQELRKTARSAGLLVTGGSDCHGPGPRFPGSTSIGSEEWNELQARLGGVHVSGAL